MAARSNERASLNRRIRSLIDGWTLITVERATPTKVSVVARTTRRFGGRCSLPLSPSFFVSSRLSRFRAPSVVSFRVLSLLLRYPRGIRDASLLSSSYNAVCRAYGIGRRDRDEAGLFLAARAPILTRRDAPRRTVPLVTPVQAIDVARQLRGAIRG